jgi:hypothetical protein
LPWLLFEALEVRAEWLTLGEEVMAPKLNVLGEPRHLDALAGVANEDGCGDVIEVDHHLGLVEAELMSPLRALSS